MDNSLLGAFFFALCPSRAVACCGQCTKTPLCTIVLAKLPAKPTASYSQGIASPFFPPSLCALASHESWRDECQELSVGFAWGQNCPGAKEKAQKTQALPRPRASSVPEAVIFALFSSLCGSHPSPNPVKRRCGRCIEKAGSAARHPPPCWLLQHLKTQRHQKKPRFSVNVSLCSPALPFLSAQSSV